MTADEHWSMKDGTGGLNMVPGPADERTCAEEAEYRYAARERDARRVFAAIHPDMPDKPVEWVRQAFALKEWVDSAVDWNGIDEPLAFLRSIGAKT